MANPLDDNVSFRIAANDEIYMILRLCASVAQLAEQLICNQQVAGSTPVAGSDLRAHKPQVFVYQRFDRI